MEKLLVQCLFVILIQPSPPVKLQTGSKTVKITTSPTNENVEQNQKFGVIFAEGDYTATGTVEQFQDTITLTTTITETTTIINTRVQKLVEEVEISPLHKHLSSVVMLKHQVLKMQIKIKMVFS